MIDIPFATPFATVLVRFLATSSRSRWVRHRQCAAQMGRVRRFDSRHISPTINKKTKKKLLKKGKGLKKKKKVHKTVVKKKVQQKKKK
jgi:hypothetical protein